MVWTYNKRTHMPESINPPQTAALLLSIFASEPDFPQIEGDLREEFHRHMRMNGPGAARRWYWRETFRNVLVFIKRPRILQALAVAALCIVVPRIAYRPYLTWLSAELREAPRVPGLLFFLLFLFGVCFKLALGILAGHILRGRERILISAFTVFYFLFNVERLFIIWHILWDDQTPLHLKPVGLILFWCPFIAFWIATRWSARRNGQRRSA
jgi:hypothetical protein